MFLGVVRVQRSVDGETVAQLARDLIALGAPEPPLFAALGAIGVAVTDSGELSEPFALHDARLYRVSDDFPMIVTSSFAAGHVPPGIGALTYQLDLAGAYPRPLPQPEADEVLSEIATEAV